MKLKKIKLSDNLLVLEDKEMICLIGWYTGSPKKVTGVSCINGKCHCDYMAETPYCDEPCDISYCISWGMPCY